MKPYHRKVTLIRHNDYRVKVGRLPADDVYETLEPYHGPATWVPAAQYSDPLPAVLQAMADAVRPVLYPELAPARGDS